MSEDPIGFGDGPNVYVYVGSDPINFRDPTGLTAETPLSTLSISTSNPGFNGPTINELIFGGLASTPSLSSFDTSPGSSINSASLINSNISTLDSFSQSGFDAGRQFVNNLGEGLFANPTFTGGRETDALLAPIKIAAGVPRGVKDVFDVVGPSLLNTASNLYNDFSGTVGSGVQNVGNSLQTAKDTFVQFTAGNFFAEGRADNSATVNNGIVAVQNKECYAV